MKIRIINIVLHAIAFIFCFSWFGLKLWIVLMLFSLANTFEIKYDDE